ncbi:helix-turn-helix domain-containing protein [Paenibacillus polymyxa]|uniref:helix-turn-helix domain-containing protein n=1 Tax=Paenibacillus polymyxa TaxID=1406 RepID=UPI0001E6D699
MFHDRLKYKRMDLSITIQDFANQLDISIEEYQDIESGKISPNIIQTFSTYPPIIF